MPNVMYRNAVKYFGKLPGKIKAEIKKKNASFIQVNKKILKNIDYGFPPRYMSTLQRWVINVTVESWNIHVNSPGEFKAVIAEVQIKTRSAKKRTFSLFYYSDASK